MKSLSYLLLLLGFFGACAKPVPILTRNQIADDRRPIREPAVRPDEKSGEILSANSFDRIERLMNLERHTRRVGSWVGIEEGREAANVNAYDEVPDSTWFTNRHAWKPLSDQEIERGPTRVRLSKTGPLTVTSGKFGGLTPGFAVRDAAGERFLFKFDPPKNCGGISAGEAVGSRLFWAAGYNVPENNIEWIDPALLQMDPKAKARGKYGSKVPMTSEAFEKLRVSLPPCRKEGKVRVLASRFLEGKPLGPFSYQGRRLDDPNDRIAHQNRRELRALSVLAAWVNHSDFRDYNSLDMFRKDAQGNGHIVHHLIDFGGIFGVSTRGAKLDVTGHEYFLDFGSIGLNLAAVGFRDPAYLHKPPPKFPAVGNYNDDFFDPGEWIPTHPNPAMLERTDRDGFWGARLVGSFTDAQLRAAVRSAELEPAEAGELVRVLAARRDRIVAYWSSKVGALDGIEVQGDLPAISFQDWAKNHSYPWRISGAFRKSGVETKPAIAPFTAEEWQRVRETAAAGGEREITLRIQPLNEKGEKQPATSVRFWIDGSRLVWTGLSRS